MSNYYKRNLPHYQPAGGEYFVTFRLANSLPKPVISALKQEHQQLSKKNPESTDETNQKKYFAKFDAFLDRSKSGKYWLHKDEVAQIVADKLHDFDNKWYQLICYCIMPNHVHLLFKLNEHDQSRSTNTQFPVTEILRLIKGSTAYKANKELNRTGSFWQHESYDHLVRNDDERKNIIRYILLNPVKAGLVNSWKDWVWTYCKKEYFPIR